MTLGLRGQINQFTTSDHSLQDELEHLKSFDNDGDGNVTRSEYLAFQLMRLGKVTHDEINLVMQKFDLLDNDGDGTLTVADLVAEIEQAIELKLPDPGINRNLSFASLAQKAVMRPGLMESITEEGDGIAEPILQSTAHGQLDHTEPELELPVRPPVPTTVGRADRPPATAARALWRADDGNYLISEV